MTGLEARVKIDIQRVENWIWGRPGTRSQIQQERLDIMKRQPHIVPTEKKTFLRTSVLSS
jgi:hypothetical protein